VDDSLDNILEEKKQEPVAPIQSQRYNKKRKLNEFQPDS